MEIIEQCTLDGQIDLLGLALQMEEMAGKDTAEYGKRTAGERCMYEIQRKIKISGE